MDNSNMNEYDKAIDELIDERTKLFNQNEKLKRKIKKLQEENRRLKKELKHE